MTDTEYRRYADKACVDELIAADLRMSADDELCDAGEGADPIGPDDLLDPRSVANIETELRHISDDFASERNHRTRSLLTLIERDRRARLTAHERIADSIARRHAQGTDLDNALD